MQTSGEESGLEVTEVNELARCKRSWRSLWDSGAAKSVWPIRKKGVARTEGDEDCDVGGSKRLSDTCGRRCGTGIRSGRLEVQHEVLFR